MAPMSEDEHNVQHILYVTSDVALQAKHRADDAMVAGDYDTSIKELTTSIDELAIDAEAFCAAPRGGLPAEHARLDIEGGAWHRVITAAEGRVPIEEVIKAEAEAERLEKEKASIVVPEALPRSSKRGSTAVEPFFTELGLAAKGAGEAEFAARLRPRRHYSEALCEAKLDEMSHPVRRAHAMLRCNRALCSLLMRRFEAAREDAREAVKLDATWGRGWDRLIAACAGLGDAENLAEANGALAEATVRRADKFACPKATRLQLARARTWRTSLPAAAALGILDAEEKDETWIRELVPYCEHAELDVKLVGFHDKRWFLGPRDELAASDPRVAAMVANLDDCCEREQPHLKLEVVDLFRKGRVKILDPLEEKKKRREEEDERVNAEVMEKIYFNDPEKIRSMREDEERKKVDKVKLEKLMRERDRRPTKPLMWHDAYRAEDPEEAKRRRLARVQPFYNVRPKGTKVVRDASLLEDDAVFAENGFYFVCQGIDLRNCPADQQLPMGQYELDLCKKHVGAHLCRRAADLESRPDVADELRNSAKKLDWGTKGVDKDRSFQAEDFLCLMSPLYNKERAKYLERKEERRLDVLAGARTSAARLAAKAAREQLDDAEAAAEAAQDALEAEDMRAIAAAAAKFEAPRAASATTQEQPSTTASPPRAATATACAREASTMPRSAAQSRDGARRIS
ncbi:hypothetical protein JL722_12806 [Aureococcus anophagefferens]|nr:hypothetical protein JL722_12806 [Aureococcus anophagefferens]